MDKKKIIGLIVSIVLVGALAFCLSWTIINWDKVQQGMSGTNLYNQDDLSNSYEDGYNTALTNEAEYQALIDGYRNTIANLNDQISSFNFSTLDLQSQVTALTANNDDKAAAIASLNSQIVTLNSSITSLTIQNSNLTTQVSNLTANLLSLTTDNTNLLAQIASLQSQIAANAITIAQLNSLNAYLSKLIIEWGNRTEFLASFYVNGSLWDMQVIDTPNTMPALPAAPTGNWTFVGWSLDGVTVIDPTAIPVFTDINFYAVINCEVTFDVNGEIFTQTVLQNSFAVAPDSFYTPLGCVLAGWSLDGENVIDISAYPITANTVFTAIFQLA